MSLKSELQKDENGNVVTKPITGWSVTPVAEISILLAIEYIETLEEFENDGRHQIQFVVTPHECLNLAETLTKLGKRLLGDRSSRPPQ